MAHKASIAKEHLEDCHNMMKSIAWHPRRHERKVEAIDEHNLSIVGGNREDI